MRLHSGWLGLVMVCSLGMGCAREPLVDVDDHERETDEASTHTPTCFDSGSTTTPCGESGDAPVDPRCAGSASPDCCSPEGAWTCTRATGCDDAAALHAACGFEVDSQWSLDCEFWEEAVVHGNECERDCYRDSYECMLYTDSSCVDPSGRGLVCQRQPDPEACLFEGCGGSSSGGDEQTSTGTSG